MKKIIFCLILECKIYIYIYIFMVFYIGIVIQDVTNAILVKN